METHPGWKLCLTMSPFVFFILVGVCLRLGSDVVGFMYTVFDGLIDIVTRNK